MADENQEVQQTSQDAPPAQGSESTPSPDQALLEQGLEGKEEQPEHSSESQEGNPEDQAGQQNGKPTRIERRMDNLLSKLKESNKAQSTPTNKPSGLFGQEEIERGEIDPVTFEKRVQEQVQFEVQKTLRTERINTQYKSAVSEHQADIESVKDLDPTLEKMAVREYETLNYQINPLTGERMFIPAVKFSEIVARRRAEVEQAAEEMASGNRNYTHSVSQTSAVPTNGAITSSKKISGDTTDFAEFEKNFGKRK